MATFKLSKQLREALRRAVTEDESATLLGNLLEELVNDARQTAAKMDADTGITDSDYGDLVDDDPTDGQ